MASIVAFASTVAVAQTTQEYPVPKGAHPHDIAPAAGDGLGVSGHKFSSGSHAEGRLAAKAMVKHCIDNKDFKPELDASVDQLVAEIYQPVKTFLEHKDYTTAIDINPHYITPKMLELLRMNSLKLFANEKNVLHLLGFISFSPTYAGCVSQ